MTRRKKTFFLLKEGIYKIENNQLKDYPSGCTENLGVVPLFLLAALRTAPIFFLLFLRIIFVFFVFDAMLQSCQCQFNKIRIQVLTAFRINVKELLPILGILSIFPFICHAQHPKNNIKYIQVGEQFSIPFSKKSQFSVGNKKVLKTRFLKSKKRLLIKGVKAGLSDLLVWKQSSATQYQVYVSHHSQRLKQQAFIDYLSREKVEFIQSKNTIIIKRPIQTKKLATGIIQFCSHSSRQNDIQDNSTASTSSINRDFFCQAQLSAPLKKQILKLIIESFSSTALENLSCQIQDLEITCSYHSYSPLSFNQWQKQIQSDLNISFLNQSIDSWRNYKVSFHFLEKQISNTVDRNLGTSLVNMHLGKLLNSKPQVGVFQNTINLQDSHLRLKTIATPVFHTTLETANTVKIGSENSFTNSTSYSAQTNWKFSGFDLEFKISKKNNRLFLEYKTGMSTRNGESIDGHQKSSSLIVNLSQASTLFSINIKSQNRAKQALPKISSFPIIGRLFRSRSLQYQNSELLGFFLVEPL